MADLKGFESLAMPHLDALCRAALALCGDRTQSEDLVQATMLKALEKFDSFRPGTNCRAWLLRILRNTWVDQLRRRRTAGPQVPLEDDLVPANPAAEEPAPADPRGLLENFSDEQVIRALLELPDDQRLALYLVDVERLSQQEIAEILGVAVGTVKSRAGRARAALRHKLFAHARDLGLAGGGR